jgi:hypothetical protein
MSRLRILSLGVVIGAFCSPASADLIRIASYTDSLGLTTAAPVTLPDLSTGGTVVLGTLPVVVQSSGSTPQASTPVNGTFTLGIGVNPPAGVASSYDHIQYTGTLTGSVLAPTGSTPTFSGGFTGQVLGEQFPVGGPSELSDPEISDLNGLWTNMNRVHLSGQVITGPTGLPLLQTTLTIDPPEFVVPGTGGSGGVAAQVPVPEPAAFAAFAVLFGGLALHRRRSRP